MSDVPPLEQPAGKSSQGLGMRIAAVGRAFPKHYYNQETLLAAFKRIWADRLHTTACLGRLHRNVLVQGRHLALSVEEYERLDSFTERNDAFIR